MNLSTKTVIKLASFLSSLVDRRGVDFATEYGFANEGIVGLKWGNMDHDEPEFLEIEFPCGKLAYCMGVWILTCNQSNMAIFTQKETA